MPNWKISDYVKNALTRTHTQIPMHETATHEECSPIFRDLVKKQLIPKLRAFAPDLLFISAGFDGHHEDQDGNRSMFHLLEDDYVSNLVCLCSLKMIK